MKPRIIILGGCGFIGRNLVHFLIKNDLVECIKVVDKVPPQTAWLSPTHLTSFDNSKVHFKSCNLINPESCKTAFAPDASGNKYDYVVNCAAETKPGQSDPVYKEGILKLSTLCALEAAQQGVKHFIELSSGNMGSSDKIPLTEDCMKDPWTNVAKWKSQVEEVLSTIPGLQYTILRPAIVYGIGDRSGLGYMVRYGPMLDLWSVFDQDLSNPKFFQYLSLNVICDFPFLRKIAAPRLVIGSVYKHLGECMKLLWSKNLKMNTVHVEDVCHAIWHVLSRDDTKQKIYNVVDSGDSTQGSISCLISDIFNINHDYWGSTISSIAKADLVGAVEEINDKHLAPWAELCSRDGVLNTPLSPYIDKELLSNKNLYLDGSKLRQTNFTYKYPEVTAEKLKEVLVDYAKMNLFPKSMVL